MPRYDDRYSSNTRLYVGHLSSRTRSRDLEHIFNRYGRVRNVDMKRDYAFIDFSDPRDADDARHYLDGRDVDGRRITVEFARGTPRGPGGVREFGGRGPIPGTGRCFNCGIDGHWARDCRAGDWKNKCYRCGERGHIERNCQNSPKKLSRSGRSYSRSPVRSSSPRRGRNRERSFSRSRSYSRSRSPARGERDVRSPNRKSPEPRRGTPSPSSSKACKRSSPTPNNDSPRKSPSPIEDSRPTEQEQADYSDSPKGRNQLPSPPAEDTGGGELKHEEGAYNDSPKEGYRQNLDPIDEDRDGPEQEPKEDYRQSPDCIDEDAGGLEQAPKEDYERSPDPIDEERGGSEQEPEYRQKRDPSPIYTVEQEQDHEEGYIDYPKESSQSPPGAMVDSRSPRGETSPTNDDDDDDAGGGLPPST